MNKRLRNYQEDLIESLKDPKEAQAYLNEALMDEDQSIFLLALKNVLQAQGTGMSELSERAQLNRESLYRTLSKRGNPKLTSIVSVLNALGMTLAVQPFKHK